MNRRGVKIALWIVFVGSLNRVIFPYYIGVFCKTHRIELFINPIECFGRMFGAPKV